METPLCEVCVKSDILCSGCEKALEKGKITETDIKVSRALYKLGKKQTNLKNVILKKAIEAENLLILVTQAGKAGTLIGKKGKTAKVLAKTLNKKIRIIEDTEIREIIQNVLAPARLLGVNILYPPNEKSIYRIRIPEEDEERLPAKKTTLKNTIQTLVGREVTLTFE